MKYFILFSLAILFSKMMIQSAMAEEKQKVIYKYKKYERFDLGNLQIKGSIIAPGDISVKERDRHAYIRSLYIRNDFFKETTEDILYLR